jgi:hypothetical protein
MKKRKNLSTRINPPPNTAPSYSQELPPFHVAFPIKITYKDGVEEKICYFSCKEHLQTYIKRYKLKKNQVNIEKTQPKGEE